MKEFNNIDVRDLDRIESQNTYGGLTDPYMRDLGRACGILIGIVANAAEWVWEKSSSPAPGDNTALLQTNTLTLFN